ncbi:hypothetical protein C8R44DRAFT_877154 [Mycena epipterygia]|nr:hypothetical protein C8R44DRAFT_877154 [Mycena epipterygia]
MIPVAGLFIFDTLIVSDEHCRPARRTWLAGRFFSGFNVGIMYDVATPLYQAKIAHPSIRGRLMTLQQSKRDEVHAGSRSILRLLERLKGHPAEWRPILGIQMSTIEQNTSVICNPTVDHSRPAIDLIHLTAPESPRWLAEKGHTEEAQATLARLHGHGDIRDPSSYPR